MTATALSLLVTLLASGPKNPERVPVPVRPEPVGRLDHPAICEASGFVRSRKHPGIYWTHNDSGNPPALFAVRRAGTLVREFRVNVPNVDWEDIATDDDGHLYLGEIGNNAGRLPLRAVYQFDEPDPNRPDGDRVLKVKAACYYRFPKGGGFDAEGLAVDGTRLLIVAKTFDHRDAEVYTLPFNPPAPLLRPATPKRLGTLPGFQEPVTGASLSPDGQRLAVSALGLLGVYERRSNGPWTLVSLHSFHLPEQQVEAVTWDGDDLLLAGEGRGLFLVRLGRGEPNPQRPTANHE